LRHPFSQPFSGEHPACLQSHHLHPAALAALRGRHPLSHGPQRKLLLFV
jgi:hypothetical protein